MRSSAWSSARDRAASSASTGWAVAFMARIYQDVGRVLSAYVTGSKGNTGGRVAVEEIQAGFRRQRPRQPVTLDFVAALRAQECQLFSGLDAFRHHPDLQRMGHGDDGGGDRGIVGIGGDVAHEFLVDLEG